MSRAPRRGIETMDVKRLDFSLDADEPFAISRGKYATAGGKASFDMHFAFEFGFVLEGSVRRIYSERMEGLEKGEGDAWFCDIWEPHGIEIGKAPAKLLVVVAWPPALSALRCPCASGVPLSAPFSAPLDARPSIPEKSKPELLEMARFIMGCDTESPYGRFRAWSRFQEMLSIIIEGWKEAPRQAKPQRTGPRGSIAPAIELALSKRRPVALREGAAACGMGRTKFAKAFSELMGTSYAKFGLARRLGLAAKAILDGNMALKDAAFENGFVDASHLHRAFTRRFGMSPEAYRKTHLLKRASD